MAGACSAQPNEPCFAFLLKGDVIAVCQGKTSQITHRGDIEDFAVSDELSSLAYTTSRTTKRDAVSSMVAFTATVVNLKTGAIKQIEGEERLVSTCGGILGNSVGPRTSRRDVVTGKDFDASPYTFFRCSADRRVVAGFIRDRDTKDQKRDLYEGTPPSRKIATAADASTSIDDFNVSPDGSKVAWFGNGRLCLLAGTEPAHCVDHSGMSDPVSVNDAGEALAASGTGQGCFYKTPYNFSPPQRGERANDECFGIGYWKAGMSSIVYIEPIGRNPQWLSLGTAGLLRDWSGHSGVRSPVNGGAVHLQ